MNNKHKILRIAIALFMVLSASLSVGKTLAYWVEINGDAEVTTGTVATSLWNQVFPYDSNATYLTGDRVTNNGFIYEAKRDNPTREPGVDGGWNRGWFEIGPA